MDKYEYRVKTEQMLEHLEKKEYKKAMDIADTIDWRRVKNVSMLNTVSEIYEYNGELQKSRDVLFIAFDRSPGSRKIVYRLGILALKLNDISEATDCYEEFVKIAPKDPNQYILKYKILRAQGAPLTEQIAAMEDFKKAEYIEKWAYELAKLYHEAGMTAECLEECDDLILWFSEGKYVYLAMELKMKYKPLTPLQQEKYDSRPGAVRRNKAIEPELEEETEEEAEEDQEEELSQEENEAAEAPEEERDEEEEAEDEDEDEEPVQPIRAGAEDILREQEAWEREQEEEDETVEFPADEKPYSSITQIVKGATLEEALANGVALASGINIEEKAMKEKEDELLLDGQMRIDDILQQWEEKQKVNAEAIEKQKEKDMERIRREKEEARLRKEEERREVERRAAEAEAARRAAEEAARRAAEEEAARKAAEEAARKAAEEEAARKAAEEAARKAAEEEAARRAAEEEAARKAAEEAARKAAEEAARKAAEEEAARKAAEEEAARKAAEEEAARKAAEEAARRAAEEEAARKAAEEEAARKAAEEEAARKAAEEEAARKAAEEKSPTKTQRIPDDIIKLMEEMEEDDPEEEYEDTFIEESVDELRDDDLEGIEAELADIDFGDNDFFEEDAYVESEDYDEAEDFGEEDFEEEDFEEEDFGEENFEEEDFEEEDFEEEDLEEDFEEEDFEEEDFEEEDFEEEDFEEEDFEGEDFEEEENFEEASLEEELEIEEPSEEEIQARIKKSKGGVPFDTGFVVTGRYDLSATSEIGLKAGLTEEQKKLFSYFVPVRGMSEQIVEVLDNDRRAQREGTSKTGNLLVIGRKGSGKTVLAVDIVKAIQKQRNLKQGKVAIVTGESLNKKELTNIIQKLRGGAIIIEKAGKLNSRTIKELNYLMEKKTGELLVVLEDQRKPLERLLTANPDFKKKFTSKLELPVFINDELVTFGQTYAKENGYKLDEMGILALYSRIDVMQREDHAVSVAEVKEIMDEAIAHSQKANVKHLARRVFGKSTDESDRIILKEEDFKI